MIPLVNPASIRVATAGEALIDFIQNTATENYIPCLGGAVYNLTRALARQDIATAYLNPLSNDAFGQSLRQQLQQDGVLLADERTLAAPTSLAIANMDELGKALYAFYREGVADRQTDHTRLIQTCAQFNDLHAVCCGCLALMPADRNTYLPWLQILKSQQPHVAVVIDANLRMAVVGNDSAAQTAYRANIMDFLSLADIIKVSDDDVFALMPSLLAGRSPPSSSAERTELLQTTLRTLLPQTSAQLIALTLGEDGALLLHRDGRQWHYRDSKPVHVVDTVGAGDSFLAGLLAALVKANENSAFSATQLVQLDGTTAQKALRHAVCAASLCVTQRGCNPPSWDATVSR